MADVIKLLPDHIANQIAAGEVVQRPASAVKELVENAIDAGASSIQLIVRDAGRTLIQVIDDGCGMSPTDARMSLERHATSKISEAKDLFAIRTMGFRGEALASIAAVAQVEMRTRRNTDELGVLLIVEDSKVLRQEPCQTNAGTNISVKNLFYNVPARRNFLKSDAVEMRHIHDEFIRIALANPDVGFAMISNDEEIYRLASGNLRQRIVKIFGEAYNKRLVPVEEETEAVRISGFVGKPDYFKKTRGEQFFFINRRFVKNPYLHHAVLGAYEGLLPDDAHPLYVLFIDLDPAHVDVNVHPTKQEIKFDDDKLVYNVLKVAVRHALGRHNVTPMLDFDQEPAFTATPAQIPKPAPPTTVGAQRPPSERRDAENLRNWQRAYEGLESGTPNTSSNAPESGRSDFIQSLFADILLPDAEAENETPPPPLAPPHAEIASDDAPDLGLESAKPKDPYQIHGQYLISQIKSGLMIIDQQAASERILYERYLRILRSTQSASQKLLFPRTINLPPREAGTLLEIMDQINALGFEITSLGGSAFAVHGAPAGLDESENEEALLQRLIAQYQENLDLKLDLQDNIARSMARSAALRKGRPLNAEAMHELINQLFACEMPYKSPYGRRCFVVIELDELFKRFTD